MTRRLTARLVAVLGLLALCLVVPAGPAAACSCGGIEAAAEEGPAVAFVGVLRREVVATEAEVVHRLSVRTVYAGGVHAVQDVVSAAHEMSCGVSWSEGTPILVLGALDAKERISTSLCSSAEEGDEGYDAALAALGTGTEPIPGTDLVARDGRSNRFPFVRATVFAVGLCVWGFLLVRRFRARRG